MKKLLLYILLQFFFCNCSQRKNIIIIISANTEWVSAKNILQIKADTLQYSPYGEFFSVDNFFSLSKQNVIFFHGGWGKIDSAASTQWVISNLNPKYIINIGTAGGFDKRVKLFDVVLAKTTFVYDIIEKIDNAQSAIDNYKTEIQIDPSIKFPKDIVLSNIISADQDLDPSKINKLSKSYNASAADWESASIARICHKNNIQVIILRGISDIVTSNGSIVYKNQKLFEKNSNIIMKKTLEITKNLF